MDKYKLDIYKKETGYDFQNIESLDGKDVSKIIEQIYNVVGLLNNNKGLFDSLANTLRSKNFNEEFTYNIRAVFKEFDWIIEGDTLIIWNEKDIDKINSNTLVNNWDYLWYGTSDESVILYQKEKKKILLITDHGQIFFY